MSPTGNTTIGNDRPSRLLLTSGAEVRLFLRKPDWRRTFLPVAGARSVQGLLERAGAPQELRSRELAAEERQEASLARVVAMVSAIDGALGKKGVPETRRAYVCGQLMFELGAHENRRTLAATGAPLFVIEEGEPSPWRYSHVARIAFGTRARTPFLPLLHPFGSSYILDMRANNARTPPRPGMPRHVRLTAQVGRSNLQLAFRNAIQGLRARARPQEASRALVVPGPAVPDQALAAAIRSAIGGVEDETLVSMLPERVVTMLAGIEAHKAAIDLMLARFSSRLEFVAMDSPANPLEVALAEGCREKSIPVVEESHGSIVVHGGGPREKAAAFLAAGGYNWTPAASLIVPRSPAQALGLPAGMSVLKVNRVIPYNAAPAGRSGFRILFAPNFVRWSIAIPGLTATCFDTEAAARKLAGVVASRSDWSLDIRVKVTTKDTPGERDMSNDRGLMPEDLFPLYSMGANIRDASRDSWSALLKSCDLVVTEGMTAVMYDALEHRVPVLLMNRSARRVPSLPAARLADACAGRCAVYASSCEEDIASLLALVQERHQGKPLTDEELRSYCWIDESGDEGNWLERAWRQASPGGDRRYPPLAPQVSSAD